MTVAVANLVFVDELVKEIAERLMSLGESFPVIPGFFDLALVHNRGCAWGMFQGKVWPLAVFALLVMAVLIWKRKSIFDSAVTECLLYAGIVGNLIDRLFRGYVVDMFDFHWGDAYHFPCFNVADSCICIAAGLLVLSSFLKPRRKSADKSAAS